MNETMAEVGVCCRICQMILAHDVEMRSSLQNLPSRVQQCPVSLRIFHRCGIFGWIQH